MGLAAPSARAQSIRCDRRIVSVGEPAYVLERRCGPPDHRAVIPEFRAVTVRDARGNAIRQAVDEDIEILTYAGRGGDLMRIVTVRRGVVAAIRTADRVVSTDRAGCAIAVLPRRATVGQIKMACGVPVDRRQWTEDRAVRIDGQTFRRRFQVEQWVYDPGRGRLLRFFRFENGRLVKVETGRRSPS